MKVTTQKTIRLCCQRGIVSLLLVLICQFAIAQGFDEGSYLYELNTFNVLPLDSLWRYHSGDTTSWAEVAFDDKQWPTVNAQFLRDLSGKPLPWIGLGWFRKRFIVPDSLRGRAIALQMGHFGASEIYLDGKLMLSYGRVGKTLDEEQIFAPRKPVLLSLDSQATHVLAIRYSNHWTNLPTANRIDFKGFRLLIAPPELAFREARQIFPYQLVSLSFVVAFCIFFCFVYGFYPRRLPSLMSAFWLASLSFIFISSYTSSIASEGSLLIRVNFLWEVAFACSFGWQLLFLYCVYYSKFPRIGWLVVGLMVINVLTSIFHSPLSVIVKPLNLLMLIESWRIIVLGVWNKKTGFWILAIGRLVLTLGYLVVILDVFGLFPPYIFTTTRAFLTVLTDLSNPLTLALHLAWEFGSANRELRRQLIQVRQLSEKTFQQEQEKQQLLALQNETLERQVAERTVEIVTQKEEIAVQRDQVSKTLAHLKSTQTQLIQSEKMASLGELTAGIAHEIQNPLNFVNNFSEVSAELVDEIEQEIKAGNPEEVLSLTADLKGNLEKISHHGKRADSIVKGMLQHSRTSSGEKQLININALVDEYLRLAYQGLRVKDKDINADFTLEADPAIGKIEVIPQDIGRVLLNLFNNAFYATQLKKVQLNGQYQPQVLVSTKAIQDKVEIRIRDNGAGIPESIKTKIFQPFFTTKPTGEGTGLGLSLSYDIITKGHGGLLKVESREGEFTEMTIELPKV
jgi:two-component system, NtrC family, sensor kinase